MENKTLQYDRLIKLAAETKLMLPLEKPENFENMIPNKSLIQRLKNNLEYEGWLLNIEGKRPFMANIF